MGDEVMTVSIKQEEVPDIVYLHWIAGETQAEYIQRRLTGYRAPSGISTAMDSIIAQAMFITSCVAEMNTAMTMMENCDSADNNTIENNRTTLDRKTRSGRVYFSC
jgi:hypothetical protein